MTYPFLSALTIICYLITTGLLIYQTLQDQNQTPKRYRVLMVGFIGVILHGILLTLIFNVKGALNFSVFNSMSLVSFTIIALLMVSSVFKPVEVIGIIVFPIASLVIILSYSIHRNFLIDEHSISLFSHILLSILAYSLLSLAAVQALIVWFQNKQLHNHHPNGLLRHLPPLQTMEQLLFEMIGLGFILLTAALISGFINLDNMLTQRVAHKTILTLLSWIIFAILLWGRHYHGWRGRYAIRWTIAGFGVLMLAYFGSNIAKEFIF